VKGLADRMRGFQVLSGVFTQTKLELVSSNGLLDGIAVAIELIPDRRSNEVGAIGIEPILHQEVDVAEIDIAEIDCDLLAISHFRPKLLHLPDHFYHPCTICMDGIYASLPALQGNIGRAPNLFTVTGNRSTARVRGACGIWLASAPITPGQVASFVTLRPAPADLARVVLFASLYLSSHRYS
jgi:hypothetical protein